MKDRLCNREVDGIFADLFCRVKYWPYSGLASKNYFTVMDCPSEVVVWPLLICDLFVAIVFKMFMRLVCMLDSGR
ncbi:9926_t:CDS:2 [Gigaspora rosea]|nr:9926_t:CDS:2 [Gigaspora rosea]